MGKSKKRIPIDIQKKEIERIKAAQKGSLLFVTSNNDKEIISLLKKSGVKYSEEKFLHTKWYCKDE